MPIESLFKDVTEIPIKIFTGQDDKVCPPSFISYLEQTLSNENITFGKAVAHASHRVVPGDKAASDYLEALLS